MNEVIRPHRHFRQPHGGGTVDDRTTARLAGIAPAAAPPGCVVEQRDFEALREQVRLQQRQINDLKARQEEQALRVDTLNNGFKILGDKAEENARRIDEH